MDHAHSLGPESGFYTQDWVVGAFSALHQLIWESGDIYRQSLIFFIKYPKHVLGIAMQNTDIFINPRQSVRIIFRV